MTPYILAKEIGSEEGGTRLRKFWQKMIRRVMRAVWVFFLTIVRLELAREGGHCYPVSLSQLGKWMALAGRKSYKVFDQRMY